VEKGDDMVAERNRPGNSTGHDWVESAVRRIKKSDISILILFFLVLGGIWLFTAIANEVLEGETAHFDESLLLMMRNPADHHDPLGPRWLEELGRDITALGGMGILTMFTFLTAGYLLMLGKRRAAIFALLAIGGGFAMSAMLKHGYDRPRPDLVPHITYVYTRSFPSGHSMGAAVTYLTLGALLARIHERKRLKIYFLSWAMLLTFLVGVSRIYMGVHWPTDVLAGWVAGAVWAFACWLAALWLQRQGYLEPSRRTLNSE
jgi:undecaprenyl-diphosphatase